MRKALYGKLLLLLDKVEQKVKTLFSPIKLPKDPAKVTTYPVPDNNEAIYVIDKDKCVGCGMCAKQCPASAIERTDYIAPNHKLASFEIDQTKCVKCGACMAQCRPKAISKQ